MATPFALMMTAIVFSLGMMSVLQQESDARMLLKMTGLTFAGAILVGGMIWVGVWSIETIYS